MIRVEVKIFLYVMGSFLLLLLGMYVGRSEERMARDAEFRSHMTAQADRVQAKENETLLAIHDTLLKIEADLKSRKEAK